MIPSDTCPRCGATGVPTLLTTGQHYARLDCPEHGWIRWLQKPRTAESTARFVMPIGKYKDKTLGEIGCTDRPYLHWCIETFNDSSIKRAILAFLTFHPEEPTP
jgi:hypothetical protein